MTTELLLVRHAPSRPVGHLYGRTDVPAELSGEGELSAMRDAIGAVDRWVSSPALRCQQTLTALWREQIVVDIDDRLWEQSFGDWEGLAHHDVPDQGHLSRDELANFCPPGGESFKDVCDRVGPALTQLIRNGDGCRIAIVAHAGVVRAALAWALAAPAVALSFEVHPLSLTMLRCHSEDAFSIAFTNWCVTCA